MINIVGRRYLYFLISALVIVPGLIGLIAWGPPTAGIDFTGGNLLEIRFEAGRRPAPGGGAGPRLPGGGRPAGGRLRRKWRPWLRRWGSTARSCRRPEKPTWWCVASRSPTSSGRSCWLRPRGRVGVWWW